MYIFPYKQNIFQHIYHFCAFSATRPLLLRPASSRPYSRLSDLIPAAQNLIDRHAKAILQLRRGDFIAMSKQFYRYSKAILPLLQSDFTATPKRFYRYSKAILPLRRNNLSLCLSAPYLPPVGLIFACGAVALFHARLSASRSFDSPLSYTLGARYYFSFCIYYILNKILSQSH